MKKMLVATLVLALCTVAADAAVTKTVTLAGSYSPTATGITFLDPNGVLRIVDVYTIAFKAPEGDKIGGLDVVISNTFQITKKVYDADAETWSYFPTATWTEGNSLATGAFQRQSDTHFLLKPTPVGTVPQQETGDSSYGSGTTTRDFGIGTLKAAVSIDVADRLNEMTMMQIGIVRGATLAHFVGAVTVASDGSKTNFDFEVPEPATMTLLGLGGLALIRRRRSA